MIAWPQDEMAQVHIDAMVLRLISAAIERDFRRRLAALEAQVFGRPGVRGTWHFLSPIQATVTGPAAG